MDPSAYADDDDDGDEALEDEEKESSSSSASKDADMPASDEEDGEDEEDEEVVDSKEAVVPVPIHGEWPAYSPDDEWCFLCAEGEYVERKNDPYEGIVQLINDFSKANELAMAHTIQDKYNLLFRARHNCEWTLNSIRHHATNKAPNAMQTRMQSTMQTVGRVMDHLADGGILMQFKSTKRVVVNGKGAKLFLDYAKFMKQLTRR